MSVQIETIAIQQLPSLSDGVSLFASNEWAEVIGDRLQAYEVHSSGGERLATFLLFHSSKLGVDYTITSPFAPHIGLDLRLSAEKMESRQSLEKSIHRAIAELLNSRKDALLEISLSVDVVDSQAYTWSGQEVSPRHTYHIDLARSKEELLAAMSSERRKNIRKAENDGLTVERTQDTARFQRLIEKTVERQGISMDREIFECLLNDPILQDHRDLYLCHRDGQDLAASLVVHDKDQAYYLIGGYDDGAGHQGAGTLNLWNAMLDAKARGNRIFDLEGSMIPEVERYFRGFGGELKTYFSIKKKSLVGRIASKLKGKG
ncbi:MAG: GNAT family N-acetyltransferase [Flavobacteriales bacterium]|nr:GNAT family N-acetyltransferase [Flavobacteriales bacterium]